MNTPTIQNKTSRRDFLKTTSTAVAGGTLLGTLGIGRSAFAEGNETLKIALIGCGGRGTGAADQALKADKGLKLVALADAFKDRLDTAFEGLKKEHSEKMEVSDDHKFVGFDAYKQAIALADVVIFATPPGFRPIHFEEAVRQGKHVFMEKPVAVDGPGIQKVLAAALEAKKKNLKVGVGLQRRHQPNYIETVKRLQDGAIGDIVSSRVYWNGGPVGPKGKREEIKKSLGRDPTEMEYQMRNWYMFNWLCGDHIVEQHIHNLDVINWIKNSYPVRAHGMGGRAFQKGPDSGEIFDHHAVEYEYADGSRMFSQCRQIPECWNSVSEHAQGTKGTCDVSAQKITGEKAWRYKPADGETNDGWQLEHFPFFKAIRNNEDYNEAERGAFSTLTAIMGRMATYSGKIIEWNEALNSKLDLMPKSFSWDAAPLVLPDAQGSYPFAVPGKTVAV
ncbi:MAG: Gfo/Idh/MocA family oxidoreductase [Verrucomicrobiota bacterium]|nr:Gfo/Idh/MocA family oxidoreductase [Verrucomicrobiota bacterium]